MKNLTRREAVRLAGLGTLGAFLGACGLNRQSAGSAAAPPSPTARPAATRVPSPTAEVAKATTRPDVATATEPPPSLLNLIPESEMRVTSNADFYNVDIGRGTPALDPDEYRLRISGLVENELELSLEELKAMGSETLMRTMECISNPVGGNLIGNAVWDVVPFAAVLALAKPINGALEIVTRAADGFHTSIPLELAQDPEAYLAYGMNGELLPPDHGFPIRCLWPGRYGMKQPKWLTEIEVTGDPYSGYWEEQGWSNVAAIKINSQIEEPRNVAKFQVGEVITISGRAMAGRSGVQRVEVSTDNGETWNDATLTQVETPLVWTLWEYEWDTRGLPAGRRIIQARATDGGGETQKGVGGGLLGGTFPDGTSSIHAITVNLE